jgi:hypothetical protein
VVNTWPPNFTLQRPELALLAPAAERGRYAAAIANALTGLVVWTLWFGVAVRRSRANAI